MKRTFKKLVVALLIIVMSVSMATPVFASPSSNRATAADLEAIVRGYVDRHVEQFLGDGSALESTVAAFEAFVAELAVTAIRDVLLDAEGLVGFTGPLVSGLLNDAVNSAFAQVSPHIPDADLSRAVDLALMAIFESGVIETILSVDIINEILERTVEYAVADAVVYAMGQLTFIPGEADAANLSRRYANEIAGFNVVPFPLTNAFLNTSLANQGLLLGHSLDLVNPFWAIEVHSHGFLNLQRTYRVNGWQRTVNTNSLEVLVNIIPGVNLNVSDFLSIENYVLARLAVDVASGTYDGITNFNIDAFMAALPGIVISAAQRAVVDVITERIEAAIDYVLVIIEAELNNATDFLQFEIDQVIAIIRSSVRDAINAVVPIYTSIQGTIDVVTSTINNSVSWYFDIQAQLRDIINRIQRPNPANNNNRPWSRWF